MANKKIVLYQNFYVDNNLERQKEIDNCMFKNIKCAAVDSMVLVMSEKDGLYFQNVFDCARARELKEIIIIHRENRPTYSEWFSLMNHHSPYHINVLANSDIYFDETILLCRNHLKPNYCFALSRWNVNMDGSVKHYHHPDSQDVWIFDGANKWLIDSPAQLFGLGLAGCDNRIAEVIEKAGYKIFNVSNDIKTYHVHNSRVRNYLDEKGIPTLRVPGPYKILPIMSLKDLPVLQWVKELANIKRVVAHSQFHEDAIIEFIFSHIGAGSQFIDIGAGAYDGKMSNTRKLFKQGWRGLGFDMSETKDEYIVKEFITPENVCDVMEKHQVPKEVDFLNLDIDSSDFWVLKNLLKKYSPRVICTEFNGTLDPNVSKVLTYEPGYMWDKTNKYGYSFAAGKKLLEENGYTIIFNLHDVNIFAVKSELVHGQTFDVPVKQVHYHPHNPDAVWENY